MSDSRWFSRHRLAWVILTGSFISCILLTITVPLGISAFVQKAARLLEITVQANQGTVGIEEENGPRRAVLAGELPQSVGPRNSIRTDTTASALLTVTPPDQPEPLTLMQISSNSIVQLAQATTPRFALSNSPHRLNIDLQAGRVRLDIPPFTDRALELIVTTPQGGVVSIKEWGRYMLEVSNDTTQVLSLIHI